MRHRSRLRAAALAIAISGSVLRAAETAPTAAPSPTAASTAPAAAPTTASAPTSTAALDAATKDLPAAEALALILRSLPALGGPDRSIFATKAAGLALMLGRYSDAASAYETAADGGAALLLRAARCRIASGELDRAEDLAALVLMKTAGDPAARENAALSRLVGAWVLAARDREADAAALAQGVLDAERREGGAGGAARLEARFLLWLCSPAQGKAAAQAALVSEYPGSPEALIAQGKATFVPMPHWYLGLLAKAGPEKPPAEASSSTPRPPEPVKAPGETPVRRARLQVGYFSREEDAARLGAELRGKDFEAEVEKTLRAGTAESRWIVVVFGGDSAAMQERLKDAGYESYPLD